jgi:hypothetical protein
LETQCPAEQLVKDFPEVSGYLNKTTEEKNLWEVLKEDDPDLFEVCLYEYAKKQEQVEYCALRDAAGMLFEFALGRGLKDSEEKRHMIERWWAKNLKEFEESKDTWLVFYGEEHYAPKRNL